MPHMPRRVVVTGGGTGIGRAVALEFAAQGDSVIVTGRRKDPLTEVAGRAEPGRIREVVCDGTDPEQVAALVLEATNGDARIDVLVNNAGGNTDLDHADPSNLEELAAVWRRNYEANVLTAVLATAAFEPHLSDNGSVISIGSIAAEKGAGSYGAAKAALATWNLTTAAALGPRGLTCNVVAPGYIADTEFFRDRLTDERRSTLVADTMNKRVGVPDDIAATVTFLASPGARHITGQVLHVNGGARTTR